MTIPTTRRYICATILLLFGDNFMAGIFDQTLAAVNKPPTPQEMEQASAELGIAKEAAQTVLDQKEINETTRTRLDPSLVEQFAAHYDLPRRGAPSKPRESVRPESPVSGLVGVFDVPRSNPSILDAVRQRQIAGRARGRSVPAFADDESFRKASYEVRGAGYVNPEEVNLYSRPLRAVPRNAKGRTDTNAYDTIIEREASRNGLDPALVKAVIHRESYFNPVALSSAGARGLMQLMPATARDMGVADVTDPEQNIRGGTRYLAMLISRYHGDTTKAIAAYNAGMKNVDDHNGIPPFKETQEYVEAVNRHYGTYRSKK